MILQLFKTIFCRFEYKLSFPLTKESPFLEPIERKLNSLMENGITEQIWRRNHYHSLVENHCEKPNVITLYNIFETILNENYIKKNLSAFTWLSPIDISYGTSDFWTYHQHSTCLLRKIASQAQD